MTQGKIKKNYIVYGGLALSLFCIYFFFIFGKELTSNQSFVRYALLIIIALAGVIYHFLPKNVITQHIFIVLALMSIFTFALVPIYNVFCDVTGLNGKVDLSVIAASPDGKIDDRYVTVEFVVNYNQEMPWEFRPQHVTLKVRPGELARTAYYAKNPTQKTMVAQAIPSISPSNASRHFKKVECFCFSSQKLGPHQSANLGLQFYLDPALPKDIHRLTLSYTLFDITGDQTQTGESGHG